MNNIIAKLKNKKIRWAVIAAAAALVLIICVIFLVKCRNNGESGGEKTTESTETENTGKYYDPFIDQVKYTFSFENDQQCIIPMNGVKTEGFVNTTPTEIKSVDDVYALAANECTVQYDEKEIYYDSAYPMWKVIFWNSDNPADNITIYIKSDGTTELSYIG